MPETVVRAFTSCLPDYGTLCDIETETPAIYHQWVCAGFRILRESDCGNRGGAFFRKGSVSNNYGFYSITLPPGKVVLSSSYVGYEPCSVTFELTCDTMIDLSLSPAGVLGEVVIKGISPRSDVLNSRVGVSDVPASRVKSLPALLGETDVVKTLQRLPGVTGGTEGMSGLFVRGGDGDDNLFCLMEIRSIIQTMC